MLISVVIPMFNEQESVRPLLERLEATLRPLDIPFEVVAVDDPSAHSTRERLLPFRLVRLNSVQGRAAPVVWVSPRERACSWKLVRADRPLEPVSSANAYTGGA